MDDTENTAGYLRYWGKSGRGDAAHCVHLLVYHALDVAAIGEVLLARHRALRELLAAQLALQPAILQAWHRYFLALHDLGKFSYRFQALRPDLFHRLRGNSTHDRYTQRHDSLGWLLWSEYLSNTIVDAPRFGVEPNRTWRAGLDTWIQAVTGHHGQPPKNLVQQQVRIDDQFLPADLEAARQFSLDCAELLMPEAPASPLPDAKAFRRAITPVSWWLAGIAVLCDWLGSRRDPAEYCADPMPLPEYWHERALPFAKQALEHSGVIPLEPVRRSFRELFDRISIPSPLQRKAEHIPLENRPSLYIVEEVTGSGKTEAALMLAHRIINSGGADGLYIGLPTMATSNAMFQRIVERETHLKLYADRPTLLLSHSASRMQQPVAPRDFLPSSCPEADYFDDEESAATQRGAWLSDHRKAALLADLGVGTLDQALLGAIYSRHQALRLLGLARKVLVVDEVHACDDYMQRLLEGLLEFHGAIRGSAILLSATLPAETRRRLAEAYCKGLDRPSPDLGAKDYPLLTRIAESKAEEIPLQTRPEVARRIEVRLLQEPAQVCEQLAAAHHDGQCACWIRNTVGDALDAVRKLRDAGVPADAIDLFHARFALGDRLDIEARILSRFGPESGPEQRRARILAATQVVEQSLDLDFDLMISDLAPMDLLIQRAGRLCRHPRTVEGQRATEDERGTPTLYVLGPEPTDEPKADWYRASFPAAAHVYKHHGRLWLTARLLRELGEMVMPEQARTLIEGVYDPEGSEQIPPGLIANALEAEGTASAERSIADYNLVSLHDGYSSPSLDFWDEAATPTRLGEPTVTLRLARWRDGQLRPWYQASRFAWELSQVNVSASLAAAEVMPEDPELRLAVESYRSQVRDGGKWSRLVILEWNNDQWVGATSDQRGNTVQLVYDPETGLTY
jgi:CRISPR-associated endonuclease/helicase Cas3